MFKVSFVDKPNNPAKQVQVFNDKATIVTLKGRMVLPKWWSLVPYSIDKWANNHEGVEFNDICLEEAFFVVQGKSVCSEEDVFDKVKGERIAEARAKKKLYKFMYRLLEKVFWHYKKIIIGDMDMRLPELYRDGIYKDIMKYQVLYERETEHLHKLLAES